MADHHRPVGVATLGVLTGLLFAIGPISVDLSLPALPAMQQAVGSQGGHVELTLTVLFFGLALTQLFYGAVADRFGRRLPLLLGLVLYILGALLGAQAGSLSALVIARGCQAVGYGIVIVLIRSAVTDVCDERSTARVFSVAIMLMSVGAVVAPALGGLVVTHLGWRAVFVTMAAFGGLCLLLTAVALPETQPRERRSRGASAAELFSTYGRILANGRFAAFAFVAAGTVACQFSYNTAGPALLIEHFGLPVGTAGLLLSLIALSTAIASQINVFVLRVVPTEAVLRAAMLVLVLACVLLLLVLLGSWGQVGLVVALLFVIIATPGFVVANAMAAAISSAGDRAGAASALVGVLQFVFGTIGSGVVGYFHDPTGVVLGVVMLVFSVGALGVVMARKAA